MYWCGEDDCLLLTFVNYVLLVTPDGYEILYLIFKSLNPKILFLIYLIFKRLNPKYYF
jgi:hypothetical protein